MPRVSPHPRQAATDALVADEAYTEGSREARAATQDLYRLIIETATEGIWTLDENNVTTHANPAMAAMLGFTPQEMIGKPVFDFLDPAMVDATRRSLQRRAEGVAERIEARFCTKDGREVWTLLATSALFDETGEYAGALAMVTDITAQKAAEVENTHAQEAIRHKELHDELTDLPNRTLFLDRVSHALRRDDRGGHALAVLVVDLDRFALVNDSLGHEAGDELLRTVIPRLLSALHSSDTLARIGGNSFGILCEQLASEVAAVRVADTLTSALRTPVELQGHDQVVTASIGIALDTGHATAAELLRDADAAMHYAKASGGARSEPFDEEMRSRVLGRVRTESALRAALASDDEIYIHYQPLISLRSGQIIGAEAVARWRHPDWGPVSPVEFIPVAEESGLIHQLGARIMRGAARDCSGWQDVEGFAGIAVNVSARQLARSDELALLVQEVLTAEDIRPGFIALEITESILIEGLDKTHAVLNALHDLGVRLSLDDFGTGYSSLSYLADLPFDSVKIDRSLTRDVVKKPKAAAFAAAIVQMGHALDLQVIAEGIEEREQAVRLRDLGADIAQGYYFGKPMAPDLFNALLERQSHNRAITGPPRGSAEFAAPSGHHLPGVASLDAAPGAK